MLFFKFELRIVADSKISKNSENSNIADDKATEGNKSTYTAPIKINNKNIRNKIWHKTIKDNKYTLVPGSPRTSPRKVSELIKATLNVDLFYL